MDINVPVKRDMSISDTQHLNNVIISDFMSFNMYKARIQRQLEALSGKTTIDENVYYTTLNLHNKLSQPDSPEKKLLQDFGFKDNVIQDIINFNNGEDLDYLRLAWKYKFVVSKEEFDVKIEELRTFLGTTLKLTFTVDDKLINTKIDDVLIDADKGKMLYALAKSGKITNSEIIITGVSPDPIVTDYIDAAISVTAEDLFLLYAGDSEVYEEAAYTMMTYDPLYIGIPTAEMYFWEGYKAEETDEFIQEDNKMFYLYDDDIGVTPIFNHVQLPSYNNAYLWMSKDKSRQASKEEYFRGLSRYMNIDYKVDEGNWFERFVGGLVNAILGLIGTVLDIILEIPLLGDLLEFALESIGKLFGLDSIEEVLIYVKQIILVVITLVIAYYTGNFEYTQAAIAGGGTAATYAMAFAEVAGMVNSIMGAIATAEAEWNLIEQEREKQDEMDKEIEADKSPENRMADTNAPDTEQDYLFDSMFTVPDWGIDFAEDESDKEPNMDFLNI